MTEIERKALALVRRVMAWLRGELAAILYWLFLRVLPDSPFKRDYLNAVTSLRQLYPNKDTEK